MNKKSFFSRKVASIVACLTILALIAGCNSNKDNPENPIAVGDVRQLDQTVYADKTSGASNVIVSTTGAWISRIVEKLQTKADAPVWISISPDHGDGAGDYTIAITLTPNYTGEDRTATVTISCGGTDMVVTITQKATKEDGTKPVEEVAVTGVSLSETSKNLAPGATFALTATVAPDNATNKTIVWTSSNAEVATVSDGTVTAHAAGEAVITVGTEDGNKTASCTVTVAEIPEITMTTTSGTLKISLAGSDSVTMDWGDGNSQKVLLGSIYKDIHHTYATSGSHTIKITGATVTGLGGSQLTALDVSKSTALTHLECFRMALYTLDVSKNTALTHLEFYQMPLTTLDVSKNTALTHLICDSTFMTTLDISKNTALTYLSLFHNRLTALDVSKNTALTYLNLSYNSLTVEALNELFGTLHGNTIPNESKEIDISGNPGTSDCNKTIATQKGWTVW